jgi:glycosyltransferase involved in cell wall biosynthesis
MGRLVFFCPDVLGGVGSYLKNLSVFLSREGIDHIILAYGPGDRKKSDGGPAGNSRWTNIRYSLYASQGSVYNSLTRWTRDADILICSDLLELEAINHARLANRVLFILHGDLDHYREILKNNEPILDHVFCVSRGLQEKYGSLFPRLGFSVCHPLVANFTGNRSPQSGPLLGVFIGRFEYMKGADTFLEVVKGAVEKKIAVRWRVFANKEGGDSTLISKIPADLELVYDLANDKVLEAIEEADLLLFPSRSEGFGIVVLEAMKRGVVPIARDLPIGIPDMIVDKQTGFLAHSAPEMLAIIGEMDSDREKLNVASRRTAEFANKEFDFDKMGRIFIASLEALDNDPKSAGKTFLPTREPVIEKYLPEPVYRLIKRIYKCILSIIK